MLAQFASGLAAQAGASRLMYAMGRDSVLPHRVFGYLQPRFRTPALCIAITALVGLIALAIDVATSTSFINFGVTAHTGRPPRTCPDVCAVTTGCARW